MMKVNGVPLASSPRVRRGRRAHYRHYQKRKQRHSAELHWGYNASRAHVPHVSGAGNVQLGLFEQPGGSAPRFPRLHLGTVLALFGSVVFFGSFWLLLLPEGFAIGGALVLLLALRGFLRSAPRAHVALFTNDGAVKG